MPASKVALDFTNVKDRVETKKRVPTGWHPMVLISVDDHEKDGSQGWKWVARIESPDSDEGETYPIYTMHEENQLWKIRKLAIAVGLDVPKRRINVDPNKLLNRPFAGYLVEDEYDGREQSTFGEQQFLPVDDITDTMWAGQEEEPEPTPRRPKKRRSRDPEPPPADEPADTDDDEEAPPKKSRRAAADEDVEEIDLDEL